MVRSLTLAALVLGLPALAQTVTLKFSGQDATTFRFNASSCNAQLTVLWTSTVLAPCNELKLWASEGECADTPGANDVRFTSVSVTELAQRQGDFQVNLADLPAFKQATADGGTASCGLEGAEKPHRLCGAVSVSSNAVTATCTVQQASSLTLTYDTKPPAPPVIDSVGEQDSALLVKFTASPDTTTVHVDARAQGEVDFTERGEIAASTGSSLRVLNLLNGTTYDVRARAEDGAKNVSAASNIFPATPRRTKGFWANYREAGGAEKGGCAAAAGLPWLLAGGLWLLRRRRI